ncbi:ABC transporter permease [Breoghania sp.]|uniref:ABC transporter permease n=1 Tax=Breoghania sp. TaxID=2065378 RepID=UPI002AA91EC5|nr:ABC transporter permease [Breoghania sp.]
MRASKALLAIGGPTLTVIGLLGVWLLVEAAWGIPRYLLPTPGEVAEAAGANMDLVLKSFGATLKIIMSGFILSILVAVPAGYCIARTKPGNYILYPILLVVQFIPKTILAPLLLVYLGIGFVPKTALVFLMTFFPLLMESITGFRNIDERLYFTTRSMGANWMQTFSFMELPAAMVHIYAGMRTAVVYAITAAIVAEYVGSNEGVGFLILYASSDLDMPLVFVGVLSASVLGVALSLAMSLFERLLLPWHHAQEK